ncbi:ABC transporter permease [Pendulispora albinea]|uniref:ABC transporter permease n=1 Tax=Pendulispora albinea TaxID=2741071 RepID=A0ABZ2M9W3_9BACT
MNLGSLVVRNVFRNRARLALTVMGAAIAVMTFVTLRTALGSWTKAEAFARKDRLVTRHKVTFILPLPKRYVEDVRSAKGPDGRPLVRKVTWANWFGGREPNHERDFFASMAVDADTYFDVYDDFGVSKDQLEAFKKDRSAAIVGVLLAEKFGWKVGDRVTLESPLFPSTDGAGWTFTVAGLYTPIAKAADRSSFFFHWERLDETLPPEQRNAIGWIASRSTDPEDAVAASKAIDRIFDGRDVQTLSQDERAFTTGFLGMISSVLDVLGVLSFVILAVMALILANAVGMSTRERTGEYAALKAVGFKPRHIAFVVAGESALIGLLGGAVGLLLSYGIIDRGIGKFFEQNMSQFFPVFRVDGGTLMLALAVAVMLGLLASLFPALRASRLRVTDALRRVA